MDPQAVLDGFIVEVPRTLPNPGNIMTMIIQGAPYRCSFSRPYTKSRIKHLGTNELTSPLAPLTESARI